MRLKLDESVKGILFLILICQIFFLNGVYLAACTLTLYIGVYYLQRPFTASVFTIIFLYHLVQIFAGVWIANYLENDINYRSENMGSATIMSLVGLLVMFMPIMYFQEKIPNINLETLKKHANQFSINKTFYAYVTAFFVLGFLNSIRWALYGYTQFIISIVLLKWFFFLLFGFQCVLKNRRIKEFYFFVLVEIMLGFISFFSEFKTVFFFLIALYAVLIYRVTIRQFLISVALGAAALSFGIFWTGIKVEYRTFISKGEEASQKVEVSQNDALAKLYELTNTKGSEAFSSSTFKFLDRLQGTYNLAKAMDMVPQKIPFQNGSNWGETFAFIFTPRFLNPNKSTLDASVKASKYTGIQYAGITRGTSFSLGYFADSYVDFGSFGMLFVLLGIGLLYGLSYNYFLRNSSPNYIFNYAIVSALYMRFFAFEMDNIFFIGGLITDIMMYFLLSKFFFPWLYRMLLAPNGSDS